MVIKNLTLNEIILKAVLSLTNGDLKRKFTAEELLIEVWSKNKSFFGLRGFEDKYPDSNKLYVKIDGVGGLVKKGLLKKIGERQYVLTEAAFFIASNLGNANREQEIKLERSLEEEISSIINHKVFSKWLKDPSEPKLFRESGWFWGIAPGTPPGVVREKLQHVESILKISMEYLKKKGVKEVVEQKGKVLFDEKMIKKCLNFHNILKERFKKDLKILLEE